MLVANEKRPEAKSIECSLDDINKLQLKNKTTFYKSSFNFLLGHNGFRPGELHLIFGTAGSGKSTLVRALCRESSEGARVLVWGTEETREDFILATADTEWDLGSRKNLFVISEKEMKPEILKSPRVYLEYFKQQVDLLNPHLIVFDNITTSVVYNGLPFKDQMPFVQWIESFCKSKSIALVAVAHTKSGVSEGQGTVLEPEDIRGNKGITNIAAYLYIFQRVRIEDKFHTFIRVRKSRFHRGQEGFFYLNYDLKKNTYTGDRKLPFKDLSELFKKRDKL